MKVKAGEKMEKYLNIFKEQNNPLNIKIRMIVFKVEIFGTLGIGT